MSDCIMLHFAGGRQIHENDDELDMLETESKEEVKAEENATLAQPEASQEKEKIGRAHV